MLDEDIKALKALGASCAEGTYRHDYRERVAVERAVFNAAKLIAKMVYDVELTGFSASAREAVEERIRAQPELQEAAYGLRVAFELAAVGAALCSGSAYVRKDVTFGSIDGRSKALKVYGYRLARYADFVTAFVQQRQPPASGIG